MFKRRGQTALQIGLAIGAVVLLFAFIVLNPIYFVQSGEKAVIREWGKVNPTIVNEGMHLKCPFKDEVIKVDVRPFTVNEDALAYTKDNQPIKVSYSVIATRPIDDISTTVIQYSNNPYANFARNKIVDTLKAVGGRYTASEFVTKRETIKLQFVELSKKAVINSQNNKPSINIIDIPIANVDFDDEYEAAIKAKQVAQQEAQKAEYKLQQARVDAQASVAKAEGEARALTITAQAIAKNPAIVKLEEVKKWDGHYPLSAKVIGGGATIVDSK